MTGPILGSKELYIQEHERLVDEFMELTGCDWSDAYDATADAAGDAARDRAADMVDEAMTMRDEAND